MNDRLPGTARNRAERRAENAERGRVDAKLGSMYDRIAKTVDAIAATTMKRGLAFDPAKNLALRAHPDALRYFAICFVGNSERAADMRFGGPTDAWDYQWRGIAIYERPDEPRGHISLEWDGECVVKLPSEAKPIICESKRRDVVVAALA